MTLPQINTDLLNDAFVTLNKAFAELAEVQGQSAASSGFV